MKKTIFMLTLAITALLSASQAFADNKVGYVDMDRVLREYPKFQAATKQLQDIAERKETNAKAAFDKEKDQKKKEQIVTNMQKEMAQEEQKVMRPIFQAVNDTVNKVARQRGISVVVNKAFVYYGGIDLTSDVVSALKR